MQSLNEEGIAYGWFMLSLFFLAGAGIWLGLNIVYNEFITAAINPMVAGGTMGMQTYNYLSFFIALEKYLPVFMLLGGFIWAINRAIYAKQAG